MCVQLIGARGEPVIYLWPEKKKKSKKILAPDIHQFEQQGSLFVISEPTSPREANAEQSIDEQREAVD